MKNKDELCKLINHMACILSVRMERKYNHDTDSLQKNIEMILSPKFNYLGEKCLKITFFNVSDVKFDDGVFNTLFTPMINIEDTSGYGYESDRFIIREVEDEFKISCNRFEYEFVTVE